jgi:hypothetical protein
MPAPPVIFDLVERFDQQIAAYKSGQCNEARLRQEFVDPMFEALGWDMENISGYAEAYKDVIHEDAIKVGVSSDFGEKIGKHWLKRCASTDANTRLFEQQRPDSVRATNSKEKFKRLMEGGRA